jgi:hypothetical protein
MSRISTWALRFNYTIQVATAQPTQPVYRLFDLFTTRDGSWEPNNKEGSLELWARETYLKPWGHPDYFDDAGADHHLFGGIYDPSSKSMVKTAKILYYTWTDNQNHTVQPVKSKSGWANIVIFNSFNPDLDDNPQTGERGAWAWRPDMGVPADVVRGGGMPFNFHVSTFATWVLEEGTVIPPDEDPCKELISRTDVLEAWARSWSKAYPGGPQYG